MAKRKRVKKGVQAPKAVKRGGQPRASNGSQRSSRAAISSVMPRPRMSVSSTKDVTTVRGMELIDSVITSGLPKRRSFLLNAGNNQFFKKLGPMALAFEKFRFRKVRLMYWTQSPSNRSGIVSAVVQLDPLADLPNDPQSYMAFEEAITGPISLDRVSPHQDVKDPRWYYIAADTSVTNATDPTTRYQGVVTWQSQASATADVGLLAGYLGLEYEVELLGQRPSRPKILAVNGTASQSFSGSASSATNTAEYSTVPSAIGSYDCDPLSKSAPVSGYATNTTLSNSFLTYLGKRFVNYYFPISGATTPEGEQISNPKGFTPKAPVLFYRSAKGPWVLEWGGVQQDTVPEHISIAEVSTDDEKCGILVPPIKLSSLRSDRQYELRSNAAGDVTVYLGEQRNDGTTTNVQQQLYSAGTGSQNLYGAFRTAATTSVSNGTRYVVRVQPTGTETRTLDASIPATVSYTDADGDEELF